MAIPKYSQTIRDPGLGTVQPANSAFLFIGTSSAGTPYTLYAFQNPADVIDTFGQGPVSEDICYTLAVAGGPVYGIKCAQSTAGAAGSVTPAVTGGATGTVSVAGAANDVYDCIVQIMSPGTVAVGTFRYSLDAGNTYSPTILIPSGATYLMSNTGLTLTFVPGAGAVFFNTGDTHTFTSTAPIYTSTELALAIAALKAANVPLAALVLSGKFATSALSAGIAGALGVHMTTLFGLYQPLRALMDGGADIEATTVTSYLAFQSDRVAVGYGDERLVSGKAFTGFGIPRCSVVRAMAARCATIAISTDPARFAEGAIPGCTSITHDEFRTETLDSQKFATLRTHQGINGFYICKVRFKCAPGSDYTDWQYGRVMDVATVTAYQALLPYLSSAVRVKADGSIDARDADRWDAKADTALRVNLLAPDNAEGFPGHASAAQFRVDRAFNVLASKTVRGKVAVRPLGYADFIIVELSFSANVGG